jgi:hypothetical protein
VLKDDCTQTACYDEVKAAGNCAGRCGVYTLLHLDALMCPSGA